MSKYFIVVSTLLFSYATAIAQERTNPNKQSEELGKVAWYRDYDRALELSQMHNKPVLMLFQEVPGCSTCRNYGHNVLSNPLMVDAIENEFIPLAIFNNKGGKDKVILEKYNEPSWNNPVVRIVNQDGQNLVQRVARNYSTAGLLEAMEMALCKQGKEIPTYMNLLKGTFAVAQKETAERTYQMYCFWSGEKHFGGQSGVLKTEPGFMSGREVVKVTYDPKVLSANLLDTHAAKGDCSPVSREGNYSFSAKDHYYQLQHSPFKYLPLTAIQKTKINGNIQKGVNYLSPTQKKWYEAIQAGKISKKVRYNVPFDEAWAALKF